TGHKLASPSQGNLPPLGLQNRSNNGLVQAHYRARHRSYNYLQTPHGFYLHLAFANNITRFLASVVTAALSHFASFVPACLIAAAPLYWLVAVAVLHHLNRIDK